MHISGLRDPCCSIFLNIYGYMDIYICIHSYVYETAVLQCCNPAIQPFEPPQDISAWWSNKASPPGMMLCWCHLPHVVWWNTILIPVYKNSYTEIGYIYRKINTLNIICNISIFIDLWCIIYIYIYIIIIIIIIIVVIIIIIIVVIIIVLIMYITYIILMYVLHILHMFCIILNIYIYILFIALYIVDYILYIIN